MSVIVLRGLAEASVRASIVAAIVALLLAALRVRASTVRHAAWTAVVAAMLAMPLLPSIVPAIPIHNSRLTIYKPIRNPLTIHNPIRDPQSAIRNADGRAASADHVSAGGWDAASTSTAPASTANHLLLPPIAVVDAIPSAILTLYLVGVVIFLGRAGLGWRAARRLAQRTDEIPAGDIVGPHARTPIAIRESPDVVTPMTMGIVAPTILLPRAWRDWSDETRRAVLAHEQAHVDRRDTLVALIAQVNRSIFWFHPLAWWLARTLASEAEHACDAAAVRTAGEPRRYAALLVEMARAVHDGGGRVTPSAIGLGGRGLLGRRIDRVLDGPPRDPSTATTVALAACAVVTVAMVAACRFDAGSARFQSSAAIEQRDRDLRRALRKVNGRDYQRFQSVDWNDTIARIPSLEAALVRNADDLDALDQLLLGYWIQPSIEKRRSHILRLIERYPDAELAGAAEAQLFPNDLDPTFPGDPIGYERAKTLWLAVVDRADASAAVLGNASYFFESTDRSLAEALLVRARTQDPGRQWTARLGRLYARVLTGAHGPSARADGPRFTPSLRTIATPDPRSPSGITIRKTLGESTDDELLAATGWFLARAPRWYDMRFAVDADLWAQSCFERALRLNPQAVLAHTEWLALRTRHEINPGEALWNPAPADQYRAVSELPEAERFARLPRLARDAYVSLSDLSRWDDPNLRDRRALAEQHARQYAEDALTLAPKYRSHPQYGTAIYTANITLGALALRAGDRAAAVRYLMNASEAPPSEELAYGGDAISGLHWNLAKDLVERGERDAVIVFLKRMAETSIAHRADLREAAAAISRGEAPRL